MPAPLITAALGLAKYAPAVFSIFQSVKDSKSKTEMAQKIVNTAAGVASQALGTEFDTSNPVSILDAIETTPLAKQHLQVELSAELETYKLYLEDVKDARQYSKENKTMLGKLATNVMYVTPIYIVIMVAVQLFCMVKFEENGMILALIGNLVGLIVGQLLGERLQVLNFYFGSSVVPDTKPLDFTKED